MLRKCGLDPWVRLPGGNAGLLNTLAWEIPSKEEEPEKLLQSMALQSVRNDLATEHTLYFQALILDSRKKQ